MIKKILNRIFRIYLKFFYKNDIDLSKNAVIDFRCEIEKKTNIAIGEKSIFYKHTTIYKREEGILTIGKHSHIAPYGYFLIDKYRVSIGDNVAIAKNCSFFCSSNSIPLESTMLFKDSYQTGNITVGDNIFIGTNCVVLPNTIIEDNVVIGANSTVKGLLKRGYLYGGNPAKAIRKIFDE